MSYVPNTQINRMQHQEMVWSAYRWITGWQNNIYTEMFVHHSLLQRASYLSGGGHIFINMLTDS